jgi:hypothetical protein
MHRLDPDEEKMLYLLSIAFVLPVIVWLVAIGKAMGWI